MTALPAFRATADDASGLAVDALLIGVNTSGVCAHEALLRALGYRDVPFDETFTGRVGESLRLAGSGIAARSVVLVGVGEGEPGDDVRRKAAGSAVRALGDDARSIAILSTSDDVDSLGALLEGAASGAYRFTEGRSEPDRTALRRVLLAVDDHQLKAARAAARRTRTTMAAEYLARDLTNRPPADKSPAAMCDFARRAMPDEIEVEVWDEARLEDEKAGGLLGVGRGSSRPPRMLILRYRPDDPAGHVALVGKGIVFDSGGIDLKRPWPSMATMKTDMAGSAAVIAAMSALPALKVKTAVTGIACLAENMPSGEAQRPGDVLRTLDGTTVEVRNTDAEGRLVLADGLGYARSLDPDAIVDLATLTGGVIYALSDLASGAMTNDVELQSEILTAAEASGEPMWPLPLWEDLRYDLDSDVADIRNLNTAHGGSTLFGGLFLRHFVGDVPWVHLDIAGASYTKKARHHYPVGATGAGTRTILRWLAARTD